MPCTVAMSVDEGRCITGALDLGDRLLPDVLRGGTRGGVGVGAPAVKSAPLTAVLPWEALRDTELVFDGAGVGTPPAESLAVAP